MENSQDLKETIIKAMDDFRISYDISGDVLSFTCPYNDSECSLHYEYKKNLVLNKVIRMSGDSYKPCDFYENEEKPLFTVNLKNGEYDCAACKEHGYFVQLYSKFNECTIDKALYILGYPKFGTAFSYTLKDYALENNLDYKLLVENLQLSTTENGIKIPFYDKDGTSVGEKILTNPSRDSKYYLENGGKPIFYMLDDIKKMSKNYVILTNKETDCICAKQNGINALGISRHRKY